jgi:hypothetical protein
MSNIKHTAEPWWTNGHEIGDMPMMNTKISNSISGSSYEEAVANAERIVACVNYCKGVSNEDMNGNTLEGDLRKGMEKIENLTKERDELLELLEAIARSSRNDTPWWLSESLEKAEAVIANAKLNNPPTP